MHLAEGLLPLGQAIASSALAAPTVCWSLRCEQRTRRNTPSSSVIVADAVVLAVALSDVTASATTFGAVHQTTR